MKMQLIALGLLIATPALAHELYCPNYRPSP